MTQTLTALALWLHSLATLVLVGHYFLLSLVYLPAFTSQQPGTASGAILSEISKRSRSWLYLSLALFLLSGIYLVLVDPNYLGLGDFGNLWSIVMLLKHLLILGMLGIGFWYNFIRRVGPLLRSSGGSPEAFASFQKYSRLMAVTGVLVLLLTALSQAQL